LIKQLPLLQIILLTINMMLTAGTAAIAGELAGSEWRPSKIGKTVISTEAGLFVQFKGDGKLAGHGGCNRFFGQYKILGNEIEIGSVSATRMACPELTMNREMDFFAALEWAKSFRRDKTNLVLFDATGKQQARLIQTDWD
jgi:heat shock protein HslJ